jgi:hypothetical protein
MEGVGVDSWVGFGGDGKGTENPACVVSVEDCLNLYFTSSFVTLAPI